MDIAEVLSIVITVISIAGGFTIFLNAKRKESLISTVTQDNLAKDSYIKTLEGEKARLIAERDGYKRQYEDAKDLAQGSPQLKILIKKVDALTRRMGVQEKKR